MEAKALHKIGYGLYIVSSTKDGEFNGQTGNATIQVSADPLSIAVGINKQNLTHEYIKSSEKLTVSVLQRDAPLSLIGGFGFKSGRDTDKFAAVNYQLSEEGIPYVTDHTLAYLQAEVTGEMDAHTHTLFLAKVTDARILKEGEPMTYAYYHEVKRGTTPSTAPTFISEKQEEETDETMDKYECGVCGYIYDPEVGDPDADVAPNTPFEDLPEDWVCPVCGASKDQFSKVN